MWEFIKFEIVYRLKRPVTYVYFILLLGITFVVVANEIIDVGGGAGEVKANAPIVISTTMLIIMFFGMFIASAIMGVPILRDFEHRTDALIFSMPIKKINYLGGRFIGSFIILVLITSGLLLGAVLAQAFQWPWLDGRLLTFNFNHYWSPFKTFVLPNLFVLGAIFFAGGALGKKMVVVYAQAIILFMSYPLSEQLREGLDNQKIAALVEPLGVGALEVVTRYWSIAEQNSLYLQLEGVLLQNRLVWFGIAIVLLVITYLKFNENRATNSGIKAKTSKS